MSQILQTIRNYGPEITRKYNFPIADVKVNVFRNLPKMELDEAAKGLAYTDISTLRALTSERDNLGVYINNLSGQLREKKEQLQKIQKQLDTIGDITKSLQLKKAELKKILDTLAIKHIEFVRPGVTIFTTEMLKINDNVLGIFRIWIDWNQSRYTDAIRVVNVYHRNGGNDHPCISSGVICMGNAEETFRKNFQTRDVFALVESIISFLVSPNVSHGYVSRWEVFFEDCTPVRSDFTIQDVIHRDPQRPRDNNGNILTDADVMRMFAPDVHLGNLNSIEDQFPF